MDLINWSLNAIDTLFSTRSLGSGEPECPGGTFPAGYTMDGWHNWRVMCLAGLSIEDAEDIYLFGTMITGFLLIGAGLALAYRRIKKAESAVQPPTRLPVGIEMMERGLSSQNGLIECSTDKILEKLMAAVNTQNKTSERKLDYIFEKLTQNNTSERKLDDILEKLTAVVSSQNLLFEHKNDNITECKFENIMEKLAALQQEIERPVSDC